MAGSQSVESTSMETSKIHCSSVAGCHKVRCIDGKLECVRGVCLCINATTHHI